MDHPSGTQPPVGPVSSGDGPGLLRAIGARLPDVRLLADATDRESYRLDETAYYRAGLPLGVALPTTTAQVAALVALCGEFDVPIVPRGAGTGLSGAAAGIEGALTIAFTRMNRVLEIDPANLTVTTQPGVVNADLKAAVAAQGLFYAPDPASYETCTIGGNLATNAGGLCCVKYGVTRDAVLGLEVVMADATILRLGGKNVKDVAGYGLIPLLVGSQGTLALVTEATLRLLPTPPPRATLIAFFGSLEAAGDAVAGLTAAGLRPVTLELMDRTTIRAVDDVHRLGLDRDAAAMLLVGVGPAPARRGGGGRRGGARLRGGRLNQRVPGPGRAGGRVAAAGPAACLPGPGGSRGGPDGGRRRPEEPGARAAPRDRGHRGAPPAGRSARSATPGTGTCTRHSCSTAPREMRPWCGWTRLGPTCTRPPCPWAAR